MSDARGTLLRDALERHGDEAGRAWLDEKRAAIAGGAPDRTFFMSYSAAARRFGRDPLGLDDAALAAANELVPGWDPSGWTAMQAARAVLLLALPDDDAFLPTIEKLLDAADIGEQIAAYQALPLLPQPEGLLGRAREGTRTNITAVFESIAHGNPYPRDHFPEEPWNQMVLKALFVGVTLAPIVGLDERANPALMRMLCDYAHERWAAGRRVSPELWRCVGPHADEAAIKDLVRAIETGDEDEKAAALVALSVSPGGEAHLLSLKGWGKAGEFDLERLKRDLADRYETK